MFSPGYGRSWRDSVHAVYVVPSPKGQYLAHPVHALRLELMAGGGTDDKSEGRWLKLVEVG